MECVSCKVAIDPKWSHAINQNICPFCGQNILPDQLRSLLTSLGEIMKQLQEFPDQLNDWLLSNYNYIKADSPNLDSYLPQEMKKEIVEAEKAEKKQKKQEVPIIIKVKDADGKIQDVLITDTQLEEKTNGFYQRAGIIKQEGNSKEVPKSLAERNQYFKNLVQEIKTNGIERKQTIITEDNMASLIEEQNEGQMPDHNELLSDYMKQSGGDKDEDDDGIEDIPSIVLSAANRSKNKKARTNSDDLKALENMVKKSQGSFDGKIKMSNS